MGFRNNGQKKPFPHIKNWVKRKHGEVNYYLTQFVTGHGRFNSNVYRFKMKAHCANICSRFNDMRKTATDIIGQSLIAENAIIKELENEIKWVAVEEIVRTILKYKEDDERK